MTEPPDREAHQCGHAWRRLNRGGVGGSLSPGKVMGPERSIVDGASGSRGLTNEDCWSPCGGGEPANRFPRGKRRQRDVGWPLASVGWWLLHAAMCPGCCVSRWSWRPRPKMIGVSLGVAWGAGAAEHQPHDCSLVARGDHCGCAFPGESGGQGRLGRKLSHSPVDAIEICRGDSA